MKILCRSHLETNPFHLNVKNRTKEWPRMSLNFPVFFYSYMWSVTNTGDCLNQLPAKIYKFSLSVQVVSQACIRNTFVYSGVQKNEWFRLSKFLAVFILYPRDNFVDRSAALPPSPHRDLKPISPALRSLSYSMIYPYPETLRAKTGLSLWRAPNLFTI